MSPRLRSLSLRVSPSVPVSPRKAVGTSPPACDVPTKAEAEVTSAEAPSASAVADQAPLRLRTVPLDVLVDGVLSPALDLVLTKEHLRAPSLRPEVEEVRGPRPSQAPGLVLFSVRETAPLVQISLSIAIFF